MIPKFPLTKAELTRTIEEIRAYVNSADHSNAPDAAKLAAKFAAVCRYANQRLERCADLLGKGYRPEAIALSEADPDLLQLIATLTFLELDVWHELTGNYGWERAESLKTPIAAAINDAYAQEKQLAALLIEHRKSAMEDAPLSQRLGVLRRLAFQDVTTPFWREDIAVFERHYSEELAVGAQAFLNSNNLPAIHEFVGRYEEQPWENPLPEKVSSVYKSAVDRISYQHLFPKLANQLEDAYSRRDVPGIRSLRKEWDQYTSRLQAVRSNLQMPPQLSNRILPIFDELDREDERQRQIAFNRDVQSLAWAIKQEEPAERIDLLLAAAESHGYPIPKSVLDDLAVFRKLEVRTKATSTLLVVISVFAMAVFIGLFYLMFQFVSTQK
jgi:hypothetical protein